MADRNKSIISDPIKDAKVLIVDDAEFNLQTVKNIFESNGFSNIDFAYDGHETIGKIESFQPDIVILDTLMPKIGGIEVCKLIRNNPKYNNLPILLQTSVSTPEEKGNIFGSGATDYITKPVDEIELIARCILHLDRRNLLIDLEKYKSRTEEDLKTSRQMQNMLMPSKREISDFFSIYGLKVFTIFNPSDELGGDIWGIKPISKTKCAMYITDFSGHGVTSALNTFRLHTLMQNESYSNNPEKYIHNISSKLSKIIPTEQYATMFYAVVDTDKNILQYTSAATTTPIIVRKDGSIETLNNEGFPVGVKGYDEYKNFKTQFNKGDLLFLYSDALIESEMKRSSEVIDEKNICKFLKDESKKPNYPESLVESINKEFVRKFENIYDDLTINAYYRT
ncbi:SpoIIE family protein phosphatase [Rickettsiales bacterium]|nr:SpoIIE family protein phosphatase [Rickettsiales bacterium]